MDPLLDLVWRRHRQWSIAAAAARRRLDGWRRANLLLLVSGALLGALAAQTWLVPGAARGLAIAAAVALALAGLIQVQALTGDQVARWTKARAASEALKAETYRYLVAVQPYGGPDRAQVLQAQLDLVQSRAEAVLVDQQTSPYDDRPLPSVRSIDDYLAERVRAELAFHREGSTTHARQARTLRIWQLIATVVGVLLSAITGFVPSWRLSTWTAAATTIAGAFGAHLAAAQHHRIATVYAATADRLERLLAGFDSASATSDQQARFVADVEGLLAVQTQGWTDLLSPVSAKPPAPPQPLQP